MVCAFRIYCVGGAHCVLCAIHPIHTFPHVVCMSYQCGMIIIIGQVLHTTGMSGDIIEKSGEKL